MHSVEIKNLTYKFIDQIVLNNVNLKVPHGSIYGFLGPNGAGKTTTLKVMLGLLKNQAGEVILLGEELQMQRINILKKIGTLIENPSVYTHLSAKENLLVWQKIYRCPKRRIQEVLQTVGLFDTAGKKVGSFSLGMKQRLGLAIALLNNPSLLVLDEPTNGLDPNGIIEMRELLIKLNQQGITIIISSHLLSEIEKLATHIAIINKGKVLYEGTLNKLMDQETLFSIVYINTSNNVKALSIIPVEFSAESHLEKIKVSVSSKQDIAALVRMISQHNLDIYEVAVNVNDLETMYINLLNQ